MTNNNFTIDIKLPETQEVQSWGMSHTVIVPVLKPKTIDEIKKLFKYATERKLKIAFRGGGCSYGDASIIDDGIILDMSDYNHIIDGECKEGIIKAESGVTIKQLWETAIEKGYWPPVVSGTMFPTLGGALSMNIHGKNNFCMGPIGEHIQEFTFLTPTGEILTCNKTQNKEIFYSAISGLGMLGCFLEITIKLKKIYSGKLEVTPVSTANLESMFDYFEKNYQTSDYLVGWIDAFGAGKDLGRGQIHKAKYIEEGKDPNFLENRKVTNQHLPSRFFGVIPKSWMWLFMYPFSHKLGMRLVNYAKFLSGKLSSKSYTQGHAEYAFLLDYVPNWKYIYKPGSMIQYQVFLPKENALKGMKDILEHCQKKGIISYLAVFKKHRKDEFLLSHSVDGFSLALDFPVSESSRGKVWELAYELDNIVVQCKGKFYFAKDSTLRPVVAEKIFTPEVIGTFKKLKDKLDPQHILLTDLYHRIFLS
jgi:decaprenylphospho-beta-D-ribofuranose 2-oxidase